LAYNSNPYIGIKLYIIKMVTISDIRSANASLRSSRSGLTAVVVGGTNGIGRAFLTALASQSDTPKIYIVGRGQERLEKIAAELQSSNSTGTYIPVHAGDLTLLSDIEKATAQIIEKESKVDLLFMSQGFLSFNPRNENTEGLDKATSIRHYGRTLFILNLLPLLNAASSPRVISVLAGGLEGPVFPEDLAFKDPKTYTLNKVNGATSSYITLTFEQLQQQNPKVSFIHAFPGLVKTNLFKTEHFSPLVKFFINWIFIPLTGRFLFISPEESGERFLYVASSPQFGAQGSDDSLATGSSGQKGSGAYTLNEKAEAVHNDKALVPLREAGLNTKIWEHTMDEINKVLRRKM
jgi:NAD(P)-dependent dehydrogenase (short-subunit alcohol dehydrogenase family)